MDTFIYLHGFASSPGSAKGVALAERFAGRGIALRLPDLNVPDFARLTVSAMIERARAEIDSAPGPAHLIGSSLGGLVALHTAARDERVASLALLAPAIDFAANRRAMMGEETLRRWRESGWHEFHNYRDGAPRPVHYGLVEDAAGYDSAALRLGLPILLIHGTRDESVSHGQSVAWAAGRPNVTLRLPDADHGMLGEIDAIWGELEEWYGLQGISL
ncbi:MAG TPA: YqiA/YcfP family alpha/beta fold hydrolase [Herpetosiphonaceae bacterium]|nr:YqiA/YcfP family alpha/beta fold hydrolase [Herpetosiphonaceae bacterium]